MSPGDQVRHGAPQEAFFYRLVHRDSSGAQRTIPKDPIDYLNIKSSPPSLPPGQYQIIYYNLSCHQLDRVGTLVVSEHSEKQLALQLDRAGSAPPHASAGPAAKSQDEDDENDDEGEEEDEDDEDEEEDESPAHITALEPAQDPIKLLKWQLRLERHQQRFIRSAKYTQEVGETHHLNAILRRELVEANRHVAVANRQALDDIKRIREEHQAMREDFRNVMDLWDEAMERAAGKLAAPPPPPTDYTGLGQSAIHMLEKLGVALITKNASSSALPPAAPERPALQSTSQEKPQTAPTPQSSPQAASTEKRSPPQQAQTEKQSPLTKLGAKLTSLGEVELARRMAGPGGWKALIDELCEEIDGEAPASPITKAIKDEEL